MSNEQVESRHGTDDQEIIAARLNDTAIAKSQRDCGVENRATGPCAMTDDGELCHMCWAVSMARGMLETKERAYKDKIRWLESELSAVTRSGVENAKRFAADIATERSAHLETKSLLDIAVRYAMGSK